jgi:hypothetical protein
MRVLTLILDWSTNMLSLKFRFRHELAMSITARAPRTVEFASNSTALTVGSGLYETWAGIVTQHNSPFYFRTMGARFCSDANELPAPSITTDAPHWPSMGRAEACAPRRVDQPVHGASPQSDSLFSRVRNRANRRPVTEFRKTEIGDARFSVARHHRKIHCGWR